MLRSIWNLVRLLSDVHQLFPIHLCRKRIHICHNLRFHPHLVSKDTHKLQFGAGTLLASAILNGIRLSIATILVATGDARFARALRGSAQLTRGRFWGVLGVISLLGLISLAVGLVFSAAVLGAPAGATRAVLDTAAGVVVNAITLPLITLGMYRAYVNLRAANAQAREGAQL